MFDITKYKWSDTDPSLEVVKCDDSLFLSFKADGLIDSDHTYINLNKDDAIAIAKHFGLIRDCCEIFSDPELDYGKFMKDSEGSSKRLDIDYEAMWKIAIDKANVDIAQLYPADYPDRIQIESHRMSLVYKEYLARIRP